MGEMIYDVVLRSIRSLLNPELTASWEKGLNYVAEGSITSAEYMEKLSAFIYRWTNGVKQAGNQSQLLPCYQSAARFYKTRGGAGQASYKGRRSAGSSGSGKKKKKETAAEG
jgi:DNA topoisomerase-3